MLINIGSSINRL